MVTKCGEMVIIASVIMNSIDPSQTIFRYDEANETERAH